MDASAAISSLVGLLAVVGAGIAAFWALAWLTRSAASPVRRDRSFLAPTLAIDALDADLRALYLQSLVVDAECDDLFGDSEKGRWSQLGREIRRLVVLEQAARYHGVTENEAGLRATVDEAVALVKARPRIEAISVRANELARLAQERAEHEKSRSRGLVDEI